MATRRRKAVEESAPEEVATATPEIQEEGNSMSEDTAPVDDVVDTETEAPAKRPGRKADPLTAALKAFQSAKAELSKSKEAKPLDVAQEEYDTAHTALQNLLAAQ